MEKKYKITLPESCKVEEPAIEYGLQPDTKMEFSSPLTEEELKDSFTTEEAKEYVFNHIHKLFNK